MRLQDPRGAHAPPTKPGTYDVFVSVGQRDGTPLIALPLPDDDGKRRYKLGQIRVWRAAVETDPHGGITCEPKAVRHTPKVPR